jgi:hypothetical protein
VRRKLGVEFAEAKIRIAEMLGRNDLIRESSGSSPRGVTIAEIAAAKALPEALLRDVMLWRDARWFGKPAILMPWSVEASDTCWDHWRVDIEGDNRFFWTKGHKTPPLYGAWALSTMPTGFVVLVEGETDVATLWLYGIPALGYPGAPGGWNDARHASLVERFDAIYVIIEPGAAGHAMRKRVARSRLVHKMRLVHMPPEAKDPNKLHANDPAGFDAAFRAMREAAEQVVPASPNAGPPPGEGSNDERDVYAADMRGSGDGGLHPAGEDSAGLAAIIDKLNERYFVVNEGGKVGVAEFAYDPALKRRVLTRYSFGDFQKAYLNTRHTERYGEHSVTKTHANWWLAHARRKQFLDGVTFDPKGKAPDGFLNLWTDFSTKPAPGDWSLMQNHIRDVLCNGDPILFDYTMGWLARMFQEPDVPGEVALVFKGKKGCGKGIFGRWVVRAWGQHGIQISSGNHLVGRFNAHLRDCVCIFADEAFFAGDRAHEGVLKALITETTVVVEGKYKDAVVAPNMTHIIMASNDDWVIPASVDERRYCVYDVPGTRVGDHAYFAAINEQMENGGLAAMIHELKGRDLSCFNVRSVPDNDALDAQKQHSLDTLDKWLLTALERGYILRSRFGISKLAEWLEFAATELLERSYQQWAHDNRVQRLASRVALGIRLTKVYGHSKRGGAEEIIGEVEVAPFGSSGDALLIKQKRPHGYLLGPLEDARARFSDERGVSGPSWCAGEEEE